MCSKCPIYSYWLSPISLCLYRIRSFIVVGPFKNATIDFIIIIVNTLFLFNIIRMPYFVASDELTLATDDSCGDLLFVMLFTCKISQCNMNLRSSNVRTPTHTPNVVKSRPRVWRGLFGTTP